MNALKVSLLLLIVCFVVSAQTPANDKQYMKDGLAFDLPPGWTLQDDSTGDAQQVTFTRTNNDAQIRVFVHRGRVSPEKLAEAKKGFIDPYIASTTKQFIAMGAKPTQAPDTTDIAGAKAEGVAITASLGGEPGAAKIYWALVGSRVVLLTYFGPDKELKQFASAWDLVRNSIKIEDPKAAPKASPKP
jgi:hypothetical protein